MDSGLKRELEDKISAGERLSFDDGVALYETDDLMWLGQLAHALNSMAMRCISTSTGT